MKVSVEIIAGKKCTVVWYEWEREGCPTSLNDYVKEPIPNGQAIINEVNEIVAIALPALPRHPGPEHVRLLYKYASEGLNIIWEWGGHEDDWESVFYSIQHHQDGVELLGGGEIPIAYVLDGDGNRVEVAIEETE